jgi:hypothetical protein
MLLDEPISSSDEADSKADSTTGGVEWEVDGADIEEARGVGVPGVGASVACARGEEVPGPEALLGLNEPKREVRRPDRLPGDSSASAGASVVAKRSNREVRRRRGSASAGASVSAGGAAVDGRRDLPMKPTTEGRGALGKETIGRLSAASPDDDLLRPLSLTPLIDSLARPQARLARRAVFSALALALSSSSSSRSRSISIISTCL